MISMKKIWEQENYWDKITGTSLFAQYVNPFRIIDSEATDRGENPDQGGANAPPSLFIKVLSRAVSEEYSLNDRQGGARGFIVNRV